VSDSANLSRFNLSRFTLSGKLLLFDAKMKVALQQFFFPPHTPPVKL